MSSKTTLLESALFEDLQWMIKFQRMNKDKFQHPTTLCAMYTSIGFLQFTLSLAAWDFHHRPNKLPRRTKFFSSKHRTITQTNKHKITANLMVKVGQKTPLT